MMLMRGVGESQTNYTGQGTCSAVGGGKMLRGGVVEVL